MSEELKDAPNPGSPQDEILDRLEQIEKNLAEISRQRKQRTLIVSCSLLLILIAIAIFAFRMISLVKDYDRKTLAHELQVELSRVAGGAEARGLIKDFNTKAIPVLREELVKKFKEEGPSLRNEALLAGENIKKHIESNIKEKILNALSGTLQKTEKDLITRYQNVPLEEMDNVVKESQNHFIELVTEKISKKIDIASTDIQSLHSSFEALEDDPEYKALDPKQVSEVESKLIEALLDLCICHVNPKRGALPAASAR